MERTRQWPRPFVVVIAGGLILALSIGTRQSFGLYLAPMSQDLGWARETFALAIALQNIVWGLAQPLFGFWADRWGTGRVVAGSGLGYALGLYLMSQTEGAAGFHWSAGLIVGLALSGCSFSVVMGAAGRVYSGARRPIAMGLVGAGGSLGQFTLVPLGQHFIAAQGWSSALLIAALITLFMVPLAGGMAGRATQTAAAPAGQALAEAARHRGYLYLCGGFFVCGFHITFIATHLPAYLTDLNISPSEAANALALIGLFNIAGSLLSGLLGAKFSKKWLLAAIYAARGVVIAAFVLVPASAGSAYLFAAAMGLLWLGTVPLTGALVAQIFGPNYLATLFGIAFLSHQVGAFLGVWLGGRLYDLTGSYDIVWWLAVALAALAAVLHAPIDERPLVRAGMAA